MIPRDSPVARNDDPITSFEAGDNDRIRVDARDFVLKVMRDHGKPIFHHELVPLVNRLAADNHIVPLVRYGDDEAWSEQRIRTACASLVKMTKVIMLPKVPGASPKKRAAHQWVAAQEGKPCQ